MNKLALVVLGWVVLGMNAQGASFECGKAQSKVEHLICDNAEISKLDDELGKAYPQALERSAVKPTAIKEQRQWLKEVRSACQDADCLRMAYTSRINQLTSTVTTQNVARKSLKHTRPKAQDIEEFVPFIKVRETFDDPYEIASPEAESLLRFIEKQLSSGKDHPSLERSTIDSLRRGEGEYLKISNDTFVVQLGFQIWLADMRTPQFKELVSGYNIEIKDKGFLADGTGWLLAWFGGLQHGVQIEGFHLITFFTVEQQTHVVATLLVGSDYSDDATVGSYESWCGSKENRIKGTAGRILGHEWKDTNSDGQDELIFSVEEKNCRQVELSSVKRRLVFTISKGKVNELH